MASSFPSETFDWRMCWKRNSPFVELSSCQSSNAVSHQKPHSTSTTVSQDGTQSYQDLRTAHDLTAVTCLSGSEASGETCRLLACRQFTRGRICVASTVARYWMATFIKESSSEFGKQMRQSIPVRATWYASRCSSALRLPLADRAGARCRPSAPALRPRSAPFAPVPARRIAR